MVHVVRRLLGAFLVLAIVAGATLALSSRPRLEKDRNTVEHDWRTVQPILAARYERVAALAHVIADAGGPVNPMLGQVQADNTAFKTLPANAPVARAIGAANVLEGLARRLDATVKSSPLLGANKAVTDALQAMNNATIPLGVTPLNDAIARYEKDRGGAVRRLIAGPLGYSAIPRLALAAGD